MLRVRPRLFLGIALLLFLPARGLALLVPGADLRGVRLDQFLDILITNILDVDEIGATIARLALESIVLFIAATMYAEIVAGWFSGQSTSKKDLALNALKRLPAIGVVWVLTKAAMVLAAPLTVGVLGLIFGSFFSLAAPVLGAEGLGPIDTIRRSLSLVSSRLGHVLLTFIVTGLGAIIIRLAVRSAPALLLGQFGLAEALPEWLVGGVFEVVSGVVALAFTAAASVVLYLDVRVRREGIDLTMAIGDLFPHATAEVANG